MVKKYSLIAFSILLIIAIIGYFISVSGTGKGIWTEQKLIVEKYTLTPDSSLGILSLELDVEVPVYYKNDSILRKIRTVLFNTMFGKKLMDRSEDSVLNAYANLLKNEYKINNADLLEQMGEANFYAFNNTHMLEGVSLLNDGRIFSYGISRYVYMGGAHGQSSMTYLNFNLKSGSIIKESDIFKVGYAEKLSELLKAKLVEDSFADDEIEDITDLNTTDYYLNQIKPNSNFYFNDEGICYVFDAYEIAPYYMGSAEICLPYNQFKTLLKENDCISYMFN